MEPHTVLVLGAGFSKSAGGPLLHELFHPGYRDVSRADPAALDFAVALLGARQQAMPGYTPEDLFTEVWRESKIGGRMGLYGQQHDAEKLWRELTVHLASICGALRLRSRSRLMNLYGGYLDDLYQSSRRLSVITFNYDLLVERCLDEIGIHYDYGKVRDLQYDDAARRRSVKKADVTVLKLHGSANWGFCPGCRKADDTDGLLVSFERPYVPTRRQACPYCDERFLESGIIAPISGKAAETRNVDGAWREARRTLERASLVEWIGYSLPRTDLEAASLVQQIPSAAQIAVVCGPSGAPAHFGDLLPAFEDTRMFFEEYAARM